MGIDEADPEAEKTIRLDELNHFIVLSNDSLRELRQIGQNRFPIPRSTHCKFANDEGMSKNFITL